MFIKSLTLGPVSGFPMCKLALLNVTLFPFKCFNPNHCFGPGYGRLLLHCEQNVIALLCSGDV